jgi:hypothetical protein
MGDKMTPQRIENLKKSIKDTLNQYLLSIDNDFILTGALLTAAEQSARLQVYLELEDKK